MNEIEGILQTRLKIEKTLNHMLYTNIEMLELLDKSKTEMWLSSLHLKKKEKIQVYKDLFIASRLAVHTREIKEKSWKIKDKYLQSLKYTDSEREMIKAGINEGINLKLTDVEVV